MNKILLFFLFLINFSGTKVEPETYISRQGKISFFSYTSAENIEATNNQALSMIDFSKNEIAISILMRAFVFKKTLMYEHFNESYIESDMYPKASFEGTIIDFDNSITTNQTKIIKGKLTVHGISKECEIKTTIQKEKDNCLIQGEFDLLVDDFDIKIPPILSKNIAKTISVKFRFEYLPYEK